MNESERKVVLGLGNLLLGDEGLGVQALPFLRDRIGPQSEVEWVDGGVLGLDLLPLIEDCSHLLIVDAVDAGQQPGTVIAMDQEEIPFYQGLKLSQHQITFQEVLCIATLLGRAPANLHLVGIQPGNLGPGTELSPLVAEALPHLADQAYLILRNWKLTLKN